MLTIAMQQYATRRLRCMAIFYFTTTKNYIFHDLHLLKLTIYNK